MNIGAPWTDLDEAASRVRGMQSKLHQWAVADPDRYAGLVKAAGCLFDCDYIFDLCESCDGFRADAFAARSAGYVVQDHWQVDLFVNSLEVLEEAFLCRLVVVRAYLESGIGADFFRECGHFDSLGG